MSLSIHPFVTAYHHRSSPITIYHHEGYMRTIRTYWLRCTHTRWLRHTRRYYATHSYAYPIRRLTMRYIPHPHPPSYLTYKSSTTWCLTWTLQGKVLCEAVDQCDDLSRVDQSVDMDIWLGIIIIVLLISINNIAKDLDIIWYDRMIHPCYHFIYLPTSIVHPHSQHVGWPHVDAQPVVCVPPDEKGIFYPGQNMPTVAHFCQGYVADDIGWYKRRMPKNIFSCDSPMLVNPPVNITVHEPTKNDVSYHLHVTLPPATVLTITICYCWFELHRYETADIWCWWWLWW